MRLPENVSITIATHRIVFKQSRPNHVLYRLFYYFK